MDAWRDVRTSPTPRRVRGIAGFVVLAVSRAILPTGESAAAPGDLVAKRDARVLGHAAAASVVAATLTEGRVECRRMENRNTIPIRVTHPVKVAAISTDGLAGATKNTLSWRPLAAALAPLGP